MKLSSLFPWYNLHDSRNFLSRPKLHFSYQGQCQNISSNESRQAADKSNKKYVKEGIKNVRILLERLICGMIDIKFLYLSWWHERWGCALFIRWWLTDYWHEKDIMYGYVWLINFRVRIIGRTKIFDSFLSIFRFTYSYYFILYPRCVKCNPSLLIHETKNLLNE